MPLLQEKVGATCSTKVLVENPTDKPVVFLVSADKVNTCLAVGRCCQLHCATDAARDRALYNAT